MGDQASNLSIHYPILQYQIDTDKNIFFGPYAIFKLNHIHRLRISEN